MADGYERIEGVEVGQYVAYRFFRVDPAWRRLPIEERAAGKEAFARGASRRGTPRISSSTRS